MMPEMQDKLRNRVSHSAVGEQALEYYQHREQHEQTDWKTWRSETRKDAAGATSESRCTLQGTGSAVFTETTITESSDRTLSSTTEKLGAAESTQGARVALLLQVTQEPRFLTPCWSATPQKFALLPSQRKSWLPITISSIQPSRKETRDVDSWGHDPEVHASPSFTARWPAGEHMSTPGFRRAQEMQ